MKKLLEFERWLEDNLLNIRNDNKIINKLDIRV